VQKVLDGSIAQEAGLREDDVIESIAGRRVADAGDVIGAVQRQAPGTWLPIIVRRGAQTMEVIARFPPQAPK
jgi:S1-C subfamily serine protease